MHMKEWVGAGACLSSAALVKCPLQQHPAGQRLMQSLQPGRHLQVHRAPCTSTQLHEHLHHGNVLVARCVLPIRPLADLRDWPERLHGGRVLRHGSPQHHQVDRHQIQVNGCFKEGISRHDARAYDAVYQPCQGKHAHGGMSAQQDHTVCKSGAQSHGSMHLG